MILRTSGNNQIRFIFAGSHTYELLNGALPCGQLLEKPDKHALAKLAYVPSFHYNDMMPIWLDGAIKKVVAINPQRRYEDMSEFLYDLDHPNPAFLSAQQQLPLVERNPLLFWKAVSLTLLPINLVLLFSKNLLSFLQYCRAMSLDRL